MTALPALRPLDVSIVEQDGQAYFCLRDPEEFVQEQMLLSPVAFFVASCLDGWRDVAAIQEMMRKQTGGTTVPEAAIRDVVRHLDEGGFLATPRFAVRFRQLTEAFRAAEVRPAHLAGRSYPAEVEALRQTLDSMYLRDGGPGRTPSSVTDRDDLIRLLVAPHIDFDRGGHSYAHSYLRLAQGARPETVLIFGVAHHAPPVPFILTRKHFETPLGTLRVDSTLVDRLADACPYDPFEYELVHRAEHSIEFQAVALAHALGSDVQIVPVLCGAFPELPSPETTPFFEACREIVTEGAGRTTVIAAADLAHVGKSFGDDFEIQDDIISQVSDRDGEDLAFVTALDADGWYRSVMCDGNQRRVCGLNCIYAALKSIDGVPLRTELLHHGHAPDPAGGLVSFVSAVAY